ANDDDFDPSDNDEEKNSNDDDEILASTSTATSNLSRVKKRKRKGKKTGSFVWQFFKQYDAVILTPDNLEEKVEKVQCLDIHHITKESLANKRQKVYQQTIQQVMIKPHSSYVQKKLAHQVVRYIVSRVQPIYLVEIDDFKLLIKSFDSRFKMPCVNTIKTIIFDSYTSAVKQIIDLILETSDTVSLTFDIWSSRAHDSYIRITCHWLTESFELHKIILEIGELDDHYASDIVESVEFVFDKFKINHQKIFSITTNNGANVKSAVQQIGITNVKCAGHMLQLSVNLGLKQVDGLISKCKALVSILSKEKKRKQLREAQLQINSGLKEPLDVIKDVDTRWNFTFHSIEHLVYLRPAIMQLYSTLNNHALREVRKGAETMGSFLPSEEEFKLLEELVVILSPFDEAMQFLSESKYPILGFMTPMLEELARQLKYFTGHNEEAIFVRDTILNNLIEWLGDPSEIGMCCSFLDPRFKQLNFCTRDLRRSTIQIMRHQFDELNLTQATNNDTTLVNNDNTISHQYKKPKMSAFFSHLRTENTNTVPDEFDRYCEFPEISLDEEPSS
ncbi:2695_t:CDS:2, partial [Gigaspora rosea]